MKLVIVRHGDPDYEHDTLTETGWKEAELVADRICRLEVKDFYVSPLGRAQDTASCTLKRLGRTAETMDWLQEFPPKIYRPDSEALSPVCWDWLPQDWTTEPKYYDVDTWADTEIMRQGSCGIISARRRPRLRPRSRKNGGKASHPSASAASGTPPIYTQEAESRHFPRAFANATPTRTNGMIKNDQELKK